MSLKLIVGKKIKKRPVQARENVKEKPFLFAKQIQVFLLVKILLII